MSPTTKIAAVQIDIALGRPDDNLARIEQRLEEAAGRGARLVVFPECALTGYCFDSREEALPLAQPVPGPATEQVTRACRRLGTFAVFGLLERDTDALYNAAALVGPQGLVGSYRKAHLPYLGVDRFTTPGNRPFAVHQAGDLRVGMLICYDSSFPEATRVLALLGADVVVLPTNWPPGAECVAAHGVNTRAMENHIYFLTANRVGHERGFDFIGQSKICNCSGAVLASADTREETIIYGDVDPLVARNKHIVRVPGKHHIDRFADRRPDLYGPLCAPLEKRASHG